MIAPSVVWTAGDVHEATTVLVEAFLDDERLVQVVPDPRRRVRILTAVVTEVVARAATDRLLLCAVDPKFGTLGAAAVHHSTSGGRHVRLRRMRLALGLASDAGWLVFRSPRTAIEMGLRWFSLWRLRARLPLHFHLTLIGVRTHERGRGIGTLLLGEVLRRTDQAGVGCALETNRSDTRDWYARHGFGPRATLRWAGRTTWLMYRPPHATKDPS